MRIEYRQLTMSHLIALFDWLKSKPMHFHIIDYAHSGLLLLGCQGDFLWRRWVLLFLAWLRWCLHYSFLDLATLLHTQCNRLSCEQVVVALPLHSLYFIDRRTGILYSSVHPWASGVQLERHMLALCRFGFLERSSPRRLTWNNRWHGFTLLEAWQLCGCAISSRHLAQRFVLGQCLVGHMIWLLFPTHSHQI